MVYFATILCLSGFWNAVGSSGMTGIEKGGGSRMETPELREERDPEKMVQKQSGIAKVFSDIIKIAEREPSNHPKYDSLPHSQPSPPDSRTSQTTYPESKIYVVENGRTVEFGHQPIQSPSPTSSYLNSAIGALSAHIINHAHEDYIPYPPNGNPLGYRGQEFPDESPLADTYERANSAGYGPYPTRNFASYPESPKYHNRYQHSCFPNYYSADVPGPERSDFHERSIIGRRRKEPIKRHVFIPSYG